jgi:TPR repeat protein
VSGASDVIVSLVTVDGAALAEGHIKLTIAAPGAAAPGLTGSAGALRAPTARPAPPPPPAAAPTVALSPEARERAEKLVQRGEQELLNGNIAQARAFFTRAADSGLAQGALMLASTFDPAELTRLRVQGVQANPAEARKWYERARELGASEAADRLTALNNR